MEKTKELKVNLSNRQISRLKYLDEKILQCKKCKRLRSNGMAIPYWNRYARYIILAEAPGKEEVKNNTPLVGPAGTIGFDELKRFEFLRRDFLLINSVQCRPLNERGGNGKPRSYEIENCRFWVDRYIKVFDPEYMIAFGNYAMHYLFGESTGITKSSGVIRNYNGIKVVPSIHPSSIQYDEENRKILRKALFKFKKITGGKNV